MVDAMALLGAAAAAKLAGDRLVRDFVAYIRETSTSVSSTAQAYTSSSNHRKRAARRPRKTRLSRPMKPSTSGLGRRPASSRLSKKVSTMTDAELEAELEARRRRRAKEREAYSKAMRSDKLAALESELDSLRREIGRLDPPAPGRASRQPAGTPPNARWEALPRSRKHGPSLPSFSHPHSAGAAVTAAPAGPPVPAAGGPPPPPPPPPPPMAGGDDDGDDVAVDPEKQRLEKLERQKRREAKKKERERTKKKMTLADIIRSAGPDPVSRLKPAGLKPADKEQQEWERAKMEREEREARQEKERIEKERLAKESTSRVSEGSPTKGNEKVEEKDKGKDKDLEVKEDTPKGKEGTPKEKEEQEVLSNKSTSDGKGDSAKAHGNDAVSEKGVESTENSKGSTTAANKIEDSKRENGKVLGEDREEKKSEATNQNVKPKAKHESTPKGAAESIPPEPRADDAPKDSENVAPNAPPKVDNKEAAKIVEGSGKPQTSQDVDSSS